MATDGINIDPNLLVNAQNAGMASQFNYGPGAQAARSASIAAVRAQTEYAYGEEAQSARRALSDYHSATAELTRAKVATELIQNDISAFDLQTRKLAEIQRDYYVREAEGIHAQNYAARERITNEFINSPTGQTTLATLTQLQATNALSKSQLDAKKNEGSLLRESLNQVQLYNDELLATAESNRNLVSYNKSIEINNALNNTFMKDAQRIGNGEDYFPSMQLGYINSLLQSDYEGFRQNSPQILKTLQSISQQHGLPTQYKNLLVEASKAAEYVVNTNKVTNTVKGLNEARSAGTISQGDNSLLSRLKLIGVDPSEDNVGELIRVEKKDGLITITGPTGDSDVFTMEEAASLDSLQNIALAGLKAQRNSKNKLTQNDTALRVLQNVKDNQFSATTAKTYDQLVQSIAPEVDDVMGMVDVLTPVIAEYEKDQQSYNPFIGQLGDVLVKDMALDQGTLRRAFTGIFSDHGKRFKDMMTTQPGQLRKFLEAYRYRDTAGMPPELLNSTVTKAVKAIVAKDPRFQITEPGDAPAVKRRIDNLVATIRANFITPERRELFEEGMRILRRSESPAIQTDIAYAMFIDGTRDDITRLRQDPIDRITNRLGIAPITAEQRRNRELPALGLLGSIKGQLNRNTGMYTGTITPTTSTDVLNTRTTFGPQGLMRTESGDSLNYATVPNLEIDLVE